MQQCGVTQFTSTCETWDFKAHKDLYHGLLGYDTV